MLAAIIEHQPLKPSAELSKRQHAGDSLPRGMTPRSAAPLDWVVLKALAKKTGDRYSTAGALAEELQNYLDDQPLSVGTPGLTTRLLRLASRHRMGFAIGSVIALAAIMISVVTTLAYLAKSRANDLAQHLRIQAEASEALARQEFQHARTAAEFVLNILDEASAQVSDGRNSDALRAALAKGEKIIQGFADQPELQAQLQGNLATAYEAMNDIAKAVPLRVAQVETLKRLEGPNNESVLTCLYQLACDYCDTARHRIAAPLFEEIAERYESIGKADTKPWFEARSKYASMLVNINQCQKAVTVLHSLLSRRNGREFGRESPPFLCLLAAAESGANEFEAAHRTLEQALDVNQKSKSSHSERRRATILETLARVEHREGRPLEAAHHTEESIAIDAKERGNSSPTLIGRWFDAGRCYSDAKRLDEALACVDKAEALSIETGAETWRIKCIRVRGEMFMDAGHHQESLAAFMQYLPLLNRSNDARPSLEIDIRSTIGTLHSRLHEHPEAMKFALDVWQKLQAFGSPESDPDQWIETLDELIGIAEAAANEKASAPSLENLTEWKQRLNEVKKIKASQPALPVP
jgi:tetratricopeptide (TPR) repeat protein